MEDGWNKVIEADGKGAEDTEHQHLYSKRIIQTARSLELIKEQQIIFGDGKAAENICDLPVR